MKFKVLAQIAIQHMLIVEAFENVRQGLTGRQSGPVDPGTIKDCTFWDTAINETYTCQLFQDDWDLTFAQFFSYVSYHGVILEIFLI